MQNSKKYKLYKDGKYLVAGVVAVASVTTISGVSSVRADTVSGGTTAQATPVSDASQSSNSAQLPAPTTQAPSTASTTTPEVKSNVPTSVPTSTTQDQAKSTIDQAQATVNTNVDTAKQAGVQVTQAPTQNVTLNNNNVVPKTNEVLSDLNKQDVAVQQATATQQANQRAYQTAQTDYTTTVKQGQTDLTTATNTLDNQVADSQKAGVQVNTVANEVKPDYKDTKGLVGQDLLNAMSYNIDLYQKAINGAVATETQDTKTLEAMTVAYQQAIAAYNAEKARVDASNAQKKAAYDQALSAYLNGTNVKTVMQANTDTDMASGQYQTFMTADVNQQTGEFSLKHDMNDGVSIIGRGELKGKVNYQVISNGDGTETIKVTGIDLYNYSYQNLNRNTAVNKNINFHVYDNNGTELYTVAHDGQNSFSNDINKSFALNQTFTLTPGQQSSLFDFLRIDDNWIWNTHGKVYIAFQNTNEEPQLPNYNPQPKEPVAPTATVHKVTVAELPAPEAPEAQKVTVHGYNVTLTPDVPAPMAPTATATSAPAPTPTPKEPAPKVEKSEILPHTGANENSSTSVLGVLASVASLGLLGAIRKFKKNKRITYARRSFD